MVARNFAIRHEDSDFDVEYDPDYGLEVFKFQLYSITAIPPDQQKIVGVEDDRVVFDDSDLTSICDRLRVIEINEEQVEKESEPSCSNDQVASHTMKSDEELARLLQAEEEALLLQQYVANEDTGQMQHKIRPYIDQVLMYEDPARQEAARNTVNREALEEKAMITLAKEGNFKPTKAEMDYAFLLQLLYWFKQSFSWVSAPPCFSCGDVTIGQGMGDPLPSERQYGGLRVELYRCKTCARTTRFPRYNDPMKLLETREGRCGEWANCFTLYCRAFGYVTRLILDLTDHVWTECYCDHLGRWMHLDPCEASYDIPMLYEKGWNKKLNYVIAISKDGVYDVTKRYTRKWPEVLSRRNIVTESSLNSLLVNLTKELRSKGFTSKLLSMLEERDRNELEALQRGMYSEEDTSLSLPGRQSGDKEWRISRSEYGSEESNSSKSTSCPIRLCVDEHVTHVYSAFGPILSKFVEISLPSSKAIGILNIFKKMMTDLRNLPYKSRRATVKSSSDITHFFVHEMLPAFDELLNALYLKYELVTDDVIVSLAGDPVRTSLALPVALDVLDDMLDSFRQISSINKDLLSWPLLRLNRLHSGSTLASGEEPPLGISTSAFDGTSASKWEEPDGAKGSWIIYKLPDKEVHELVAYEIMSANDVPERDPKDWVVEGSKDGGTNWSIIDKQTNQMFDDRFQRKTYIITPNGVHSNMFRFKFLSVRDSYSNSRLQLGCIDLYAKGKSV